MTRIKPNYFFIPLFVIIYLLWGIRRNFPSQSRLAKIERKAGEELRRELQAIRPEKTKFQDKPKRQTVYEIGDDGELVELDENDAFEGGKPKRDRL